LKKVKNNFRLHKLFFIFAGMKRTMTYTEAVAGLPESTSEAAKLLGVSPQQMGYYKSCSPSKPAIPFVQKLSEIYKAQIIVFHEAPK